MKRGRRLSDPTSPKARVLSADDLAQSPARPPAPLAPLGVIERIGALPIWASHPPETPIATTYDQIFNDVEPIGEYLSYLAGDFAQDENGWLKFGDSSLSFTVETNFEDDVIDVERSDGLRFQEAAAGNPQRLDEFAVLTLGQIFEQLDNRSGGPASVAALKGLERPSLDGMAHGQFFKDAAETFGPPEHFYLTFRQYRAPATPSEYPRMLIVKARSWRRSLVLETMLDVFRELIERYRDLPYHPVSGATRC